MNSFLTERINETLSGRTADLGIKVFGNDLDVLDREAQKINGVLSRIGGADCGRLLEPSMAQRE